MYKISLSFTVIYILAETLSCTSSPIKETYKSIVCTLRPLYKNETRGSHPHIPNPGKIKRPKGHRVSTNWCGYVAADNTNQPTTGSVTAVYASWIVPTIKATVNNAASAIWLGIDGYASDTVEQIGTSHSFSRGAQQHYAWFEMYPAASYMISGFPVKPGDVISASIIYTGNDVFVMTIYNNTKKVSYTIPTNYTTSPNVLRNSAEWIIEAPYLNGILPLSNFGTAYMWGCTAIINNTLGPISSEHWQNFSLEMVNNVGASKSLPSALIQDNSSFFMTWKHI